MFLIISITRSLLVIPFVAMRFTKGVNRDVPDFGIMVIMLMVLACGIAFCLKRPKP